MPQCQFHGHGKILTSLFLIVIVLCGGSGIQLSAASSAQQQHQQQQQQKPLDNSATTTSTNSEFSSNSGSNFDNEATQSPSSSSQQPLHSKSSSVPGVGQHSSLSSLPVRAVSTRPASDISTTNSGDSDNSVPSHYDACPNAEAWCSSLDENEKLALEAIHALHHQLDDDKNGNIDLFESNEFLREELKYDRDYEKRQENFHRNNDNQVSVRELWETWVRSEVHNWTVDQTAEWIGNFVGLPLYQEKFIQLAINGTYLPRLAVNHQNFLSTNLGIKDVITRQKLTLKAQDVVLFGPPRDNTNHTKDAILTSLLVVAVTVCYLVYRRYKLSQRDLSRMSKDMEALMKAEETLRDLQKELEQAKCDQEVKEKDAVTQRGSSDDEDELIKLRGEVLVLRNELQRAEVELQDKCWVPPPALTHWLQLTYELESKAHNKKRQAAEKQLKQAKEACDKLKKKRSSLMGAFVATHARSIDDVDKAILEARAALTEVTQELQERMHRWKQIEMLVKSPIVNNPGLASLEILLRTGSRTNPYLGTGSVMSNSQDDIDDDGASSIYCPSAVSGPVTNLHTPIARSKSVQSMLSLRERGFHRESSSKDSSNGDDDIMGDAAEMTAKDRRVTFRAAAADRRSGQMRSLQGRTNGPIYEPMEFEDTRNFYSRKPMSANRLESSKSSEEESQRKKPPPKEEPDLIKLSTNSNSSAHQLHQNHYHHHHQSSDPYSKAQPEGNHCTEDKDFGDHLKQSSESNALSSISEEKVAAQREEALPPVAATAAMSTPSKGSFFKTISKLMRLQSDGLNSKKTKKSLKDTSPKGGGGGGDADNKQLVMNGNNNPISNKVITDKPIYSSDDGNLNKTQSLKSNTLKGKGQRKPHKFFSSLRRKTSTETSNSELIAI